MRKSICVTMILSLAFWTGCGDGKKDAGVDDSSSRLARSNSSPEQPEPPRDETANHRSANTRPAETPPRDRSVEDQVDSADGEMDRLKEERRERLAARDRNKAKEEKETAAPEDDISEEEREARGESTGMVAAFPASTGKVGLKKNNLVPEIEGQDLEGVSFKLSDYKGKVIMLDFWGDW